MSNPVDWGVGTAFDAAADVIDDLSKATPGEKRLSPYFQDALISLVRFYDRREKTPLSDEEMRSVMTRVEQLLVPFMDDVVEYVRYTQIDADGAREPYEWLALCKRRTAIQILLDDFAAVASRIPDEMIRELDASMRERGITCGPIEDPDSAPDDIPESHWWWRYPET